MELGSVEWICEKVRDIEVWTCSGRGVVHNHVIIKCNCKKKNNLKFLFVVFPIIKNSDQGLGEAIRDIEFLILNKFDWVKVTLY